MQARSFVEESRDLPKIAPAAVKHAFVDVADCAGHHLLVGRLQIEFSGSTLSGTRMVAIFWISVVRSPRSGRM